MEWETNEWIFRAPDNPEPPENDDGDAAGHCDWCGEQIDNGEDALGVIGADGRRSCLCEKCADGGISVREALEEIAGVYCWTGDARDVPGHLAYMARELRIPRKAAAT